MTIDINTCTVQEACDYAVQKIVEQGERSLAGSEGVCAYQAPGGLHCAIGWLLNHDDPALMEFEGPLHDLLKQSIDYLPPIITDNVEVFDALQKFHDCTMKSAREEMRTVLIKLHVDVSGSWWQKWIDIGEEYDRA